MNYKTSTCEIKHKTETKGCFLHLLISLKTSILRSNKRNSLAANGTLLWGNYSEVNKPHIKCGYLYISFIIFIIIIVIIIPILLLCHQVQIK